MSLHALDELPDMSRLWIFGADRRPDPDATARILDRTRTFLEDWTAHDRELAAGIDWRRHRFLLVALDETRVPASGCSIDGLMRHLAGLERATGVGLTDSSAVWFRDPREDGRIRSVDRQRFRELARDGTVGPGTTVYDLTVDSLGALREGRWERPARGSWHASLLPDDAPETAPGPPS